LLVVGAETKKAVVKGEALRFLPKIIHTNCGHECAPNTAHVFEKGIMLPGGLEQQPRRAVCSYVQCWGDQSASDLVITVHNSAEVKYPQDHATETSFL
jgi:hypothetical protein